MPRPEMLGSVDRYRPLLGDAGADAVGALDVLLPSGPRESFSSPAVRIRGALLSTGSTLFVERCQELDSSSMSGAGAAPCATA
jgi:hypothetical protein